jgi:choline dehydrogenase-like flavoprotein
LFTVRFRTTEYRPDLQITLRNNVDGWERDLPGIYLNDEWQFELPETQYPNGMEFKFVLERTYWMLGENIPLLPVAGGDYVYEAPEISFPTITEIIVENSYFQQKFFKPNLDEGHLFDVIVVGSGIGGGIAAEQLADMDVDVLVLEAGSLLFPTHIANLPRQHQVGKFDKHLWGLFDEYKVINYINAPGSQYGGGQAFNLGGRSVFWGGFIPRMTWWELEPWPQSVVWYLEGSGYQKAEDLMYWPAPPSQYQQEVKRFLENKWRAFNHFHAPMAVRNLNPSFGTIPTGLFSTADLLTESKLTVDPSKNKRPWINLNHVVVKIEVSGNSVSKVVAHDLLTGKIRSFKAKYVILAAGTIESAKIVKVSGLANPNELVGVGITDHPIFFTHFSIPQGKIWHRIDTSSKTLSLHKDASSTAHPYNILLELGADLNQGRYLDSDTLNRHRQLKGNATLCEIVFLFNSPLLAQNRLDQNGPSYTKPLITMQGSPSADGFLSEVDAMKDEIIAGFEGEAITGGDLTLTRAGLGGVAHEVGTLRLGAGNTGVVDENLQFNGYENLFVCDLSVFPTSPAANPTLTLAALALRLVDHIKSLL